MIKKNIIIIYLLSVLIIVITLVTCKQPKKEMLVSTGDVTNVSSNSADVTGTAIDLGEGATRQGHCYAKTSGVSVANQKTELVTSGTGDFTSQLTNLEPGTSYYFKAYLSNGTETVYGEERNFTTVSASIPTITTTAITSINTTSANSGGNITSDGGAPVTARGVCWSTAANPTIAGNKTIDGTGTGIFTSSLTGLTAMTTYHVRAYATNSIGTAYGSDVTFTTQTIVVPTVTTTSVSAITTTTATSGGNVSDGGGATVTARGVCWSATANPTITDTKTSDGTGTGIFTSNLTGLIPATTYHIRAYATNSTGTAYGSDISFTSTAIVIPTVTTTAVSAIATSTATSGGNVTSDGGASVTAKGVCWSTTSNPTITDTKTSNGTGTGVFSSSMTGLTAATTYHVRAYATNSIGTAYGTDVIFTTNALGIPTLTTTAASAITTTTASSGGNITADGGAAITARGVCWSVTINPTVTDSKTSNGSGTGSFTSSLTGLTPATVYHLRAYATNSVGTAYGSDITFTTGTMNVPTVSTTAASAISGTTATCGGNVTSDGGATITERGICYSTSASPTTGSSKLAIGSGTGTFSGTISGLLTYTKYYVRAYAINSIGTAYGNEVNFTTISGGTPSVSTKDVTNILETTAIAGGIVLTDGGASVSERGVCFGTATNPTIYDSKITGGTGTGSFSTPLNILVPNVTYNVRAYAINSNGTAYGENKTFTTLDAYYAGFENGMPTGWTGMWAVSTDTPYEGFFCLKSVNVGDSIVFTRTIINPSGGQISFFHKSSGGGTQPLIQTQFYIDNVLQATILDEGWTNKSFNITSGTHKFKWRNNGGGYSNNITYIDFFISPK